VILCHVKIEAKGWKLLQHPPYSPDLAPSEFLLFGPLGESPGGVTFENNEDVQQRVLQPTKTSMLQASADLQKDGNSVLNCRETTLKSNINVRIVRLPIVLLLPSVL